MYRKEQPTSITTTCRRLCKWAGVEPRSRWTHTWSINCRRVGCGRGWRRRRGHAVGRLRFTSASFSFTSLSLARNDDWVLEPHRDPSKFTPRKGDKGKAHARRVGGTRMCWLEQNTIRGCGHDQRFCRRAATNLENIRDCAIPLEQPGGNGFDKGALKLF